MFNKWQNQKEKNLIKGLNRKEEKKERGREKNSIDNPLVKKKKVFFSRVELWWHMKVLRRKKNKFALNI